MKRREIRLFGLWKDQKGLRNAFYGCEIKRREKAWFSIGNSMICSDIWHKYHEWYFKIWDNFEISQVVLMPNITQIMLLFVYTTNRKRFVIFTCSYFKLSWNTTALNQSNCRNFSCSSIIQVIAWFVVILGINTTGHISKFLYVTASEIWDNFEISRVLLMPNITQQIMLLFGMFLLLPAKGL